MTQAQLARPLVVALALLSVIVAVLAHYAIALGEAPAIGAVLALAPVAAILVVAARRPKRRVPLLVVLAAAAILPWAGWETLERHFRGIYFLEHVGAALLLGAMFGRTLAPGCEPLCTRFARLLHGPLPLEEVRYARQVTLAWTLFFLGLATTSCLLYLGGSIAAWSVLANFLTLPLVAAMFAVEYAVRRRVLPASRHGGILDGIRAFWRHSAATPSEAPR